MSVISMKQLLEAGVHFGHQTRRWNPKMAPYIYTERNGIYIIDLQKSVGKVDEAYKAVSDIVAEGGTILFVGTKKQAQDAIKTEAERCGMYYVNERWLGGMLTNFKTIQSRIARLKEIKKDAKRHLRHAEKLAAQKGVRITVAEFEGSPHGEVMRYIKENHIDLLLLGSVNVIRSRREELASENDRMMRTSPCPVLVVKDDERIWSMFEEDF